MTEAIKLTLETVVIEGIGQVFGATATLEMLFSLVTSQLHQSVKYLMDASLETCIYFETGVRILDHIPDLLDL